MDHETWIITPITWTSILIFIVVPILCVFAGLDALLGFINSHIDIIITVIAITSCILVFITIIIFKKPLFLLAIPSSVLALSQFLYMLINGSRTIYVMNQDYLAAFGRLIVFVIWLVYTLLNLLVCFLGMGISSYSAITSIKEKQKDDSLVVPSMIACALIGVIGWIINWIFL